MAKGKSKSRTVEEEVDMTEEDTTEPVIDETEADAAHEELKRTRNIPEFEMWVQIGEVRTVLPTVKGESAARAVVEALKVVLGKDANVGARKFVPFTF